MSKREQRPLAKTVKETVDYVFNYLYPFPDGVVFTSKGLGYNEKRVCKILCERGIITREQVMGVSGKQLRYKWAADMAPTSILYGSIADEIRDMDAKRTQKQNKKRKEKRALGKEAVVEKLPDVPECEDLGPFVGVSSQELWNELKARGYYIEDNRLVTKLYLD